MVNRDLLFQETPIFDPNKVWILTIKENNNMTKKWIKGFLNHPWKIIKSIYFNITNKNQDMATKRLSICNKCISRVNTSLGDACRECGCILENKTRIEDEHCDLCKW